MRFLACIVFAIAVIAAAFHFAKPLPSTNFDESFLPKASSVKFIAVGNDASVAGLFWIKALTELGESYLYGKEYAYLSHVANLCTELDSLFYTPYSFVGSVTPMDAQDTTDFAVMRRGIKNFPGQWYLGLYYALRLSRGPYPNKAAAADVMRPYFDSPDTTIPPHIRTMYRSFELDTMQTEVALEAVLNDVMQPRFKKFQESFCNKTYKLLGYRGILKDRDNDEVYSDIKNTIALLSAGKVHPAAAYHHLLQLKKPEEKANSVVVTEQGSKDAVDSTKDSVDSTLQKD